MIESILFVLSMLFIGLLVLFIAWLIEGGWRSIF